MPDTCTRRQAGLVSFQMSDTRGHVIQAIRFFLWKPGDHAEETVNWAGRFGGSPLEDGAPSKVSAETARERHVSHICTVRE
jgi:hypothetical protein